MPDARLPDETRRLEQRLDELRALARVSGEINRSLNVRKVLQTSQAGIREVLGGTFGGILLIDPVTWKLEVALADQLPPRVQDALKQLISDFPIRGRNADADAPDTALLSSLGSRLQEIMKAESSESSITIPLTARGRPIGILLVGVAAGRVPKPLSVEMLLSMGEQVGMALENARLHTALRESERWHRAFIENSPDGFWEGDMQGHTTYVNPAAGAILGYSREELLQMRFSDLRADPMDGRTAMEELQRTGEFRDRPTKAKSKDGTIKTLNLSTRLIRDQQGNPARFQTILHDVTDMQRRVAELDGLAQFSAACATSLDPDTICTIAIDWVKKLLNADNCRIRLIEGEGDDLRPGKAYGHAAGLPMPDHSPSLDALRAVIRTRQPLIVPNLEQFTQLIPQPHGLKDTRIRALLFVALPASGSALGVLTVMHTRPHEWSTPEINLVQTIANQLANALHNARLYQDLLSQERTVEAIFNSGLSGLFATDADGRFTMFNHAAETITGWTRDEVLGKKWEDVLVDPTAETQVRPLIYTALIDKQVQFVPDGRTIRTRQGRALTVAKAVAPLVDENGRVTGAVGGLWDLSREKAAERDQEDFMNFVAHQIRTPLTAILSGLELLDNPRVKASKRKELKQVIQEQAERLTRISGQFLDVQRASNPPHSVEWASQALCETVQKVVHRYEVAPLVEHSFRLELPESNIKALGDAYLLDHILHILIDNAIHYSPANSLITLSVQLREEQDAVVLAVHNEGAGIPEQDKAYIFHAFYRAGKAEGRDIYGHGFGLYIARRFARRMQGELTFESKENEGCTFYLTLRRSHE